MDLASYKTLIALLTKGLTEDTEKAWVFYLWVLNLNLKDQNITKGAIKNSPKGDLKDVQSGVTHIADFYTKLCR